MTINSLKHFFPIKFKRELHPINKKEKREVYPMRSSKIY